MHTSSLPLVAFLGVFFAAASAPQATAAHSSLWGVAGESWSPSGRLPDFSFAGYACGEKAIPELPVVTDVRRHGAKGDGTTDDSAAFNRALAEAKGGAVLVPAGRYLICDFVRLAKPDVVLRGEGPEKSILVFDRPLDAVKPNWGATTTGDRTSNYSWGGGYLVIGGAGKRTPLATIANEAQRGDRWIAVSELGEGLAPGGWVEVEVRDDQARSLTSYLYSGDPGSISKLRPLVTRQVARVTEVDASGKRVRLDRPLRFPTRGAWSPRLNAHRPAVTGAGIERIGFEFPNVPWPGEFKELGYNAIEIADAAHCWVRDVRIVNAESGIYIRGVHNTVQDVTLAATKAPYQKNKYLSAAGCIGHHGITSYGADNLVQRFDFQANYVHDLTVEGSSAAGNVFKLGRGLDLCFDHHKKAPHANLFAALDCGAGNRIWRCGGGADLGRQSGAWETFWALRAAKPLTPPPSNWGPSSLNVIGVSATTKVPASKSPAAGAPLIETMPASALEPQDLHAAQLARRLTAR